MIYKEFFEVDKPKATIIIVHGIAEHSGRYEEIKNIFNEKGFNVVLYDQLGHGKSSGKKGKIKSFHEHIDTLHDIVLDLRTKNVEKIYLYGHSMGGLVANMYCIKYGNIDGLISQSAALQTPNNAKILKYIGFWYLKGLKINTKIFDNDLAKDPTVLLKNKEDVLMLKHMYISLIGEMFIKGVRYYHQNIEKFKTPVLFLHGSKDKIVEYHSSVIAHDKIAILNKELIIYDNELHEIHNDYNKDKVISDIIAWLEKRVII